MSYKDKYLKYKNKYLELKNQVGGKYDKNPLNLPDDSLHSFLKAILLFLNTIPEMTVKYFHLLFILGIGITYIDTVKVGENRLFNENEITELVERYAKIIANKYNLIIYLPEYVLSFLGKIQDKKNWKKIKGVEKEGEEQKTVVILKGKYGKYNLVDKKLIKLKFNDSVFWENKVKLPNNTVNSFFNAI